MSSNGIVPEGSPPQPSTTVQHQRDSLMRRRAISCSPNVGASRLPYNHTPSSAVNTPIRPYLSSHLLGLPSSQVACSFGSLGQYGARSHPTDATYPSLDSGGITLRQHTDHIGGASALGFEPGPAVGHPQAETYLGNQQDYRPPVLVVSADDSNSAPELASAGMITGTYVYSDGLGTSHKPEPEQWDTPPVTVGAYIHPNQRMTLSFHQLRDSGSTGGRDLLSASSPYSFDYPSSPSACSPSSASPLSMLSNLGLNSPRSNMGDMDEGSSSGTYRMQECQAQGEPNWGASGRGVERVPVSPSSSPWPVNRTEPFGYELLQAISPMTPASANMAPIGTPDPLNTTILPASVIEGSPRMASISAPPQSFLTEGSDPFTCLTGGPSSSAPIDAFGPALQSNQAEFLFSILPGTPDYQPSNVSGTSIVNSPPSEIPVISGGAGPFFSTQVNASYARAPYRDYTYPISSMGASGSRNAVDIDAVHAPGPRFRSRSTRGSIGKKCGRHRGTSRAKELENEDNNDLLHMSISSLEENGFIQQASALKDTLRLIIRNCFPDAPTRQDIVDLLFDVLPENIRVRVAEPGVKKYFKERIGHILSAPSNKSMFINSAGGRWSLGEGPSH